jgi:hypothetical protein
MGGGTNPLDGRIGGGQGSNLSVAEFPEVVPVDQIKRYAALAKDARRKAKHANGAVADYLIWMAEQWEKLAGLSADMARQELDALKAQDLGP